MNYFYWNKLTVDRLKKGELQPENIDSSTNQPIDLSVDTLILKFSQRCDHREVCFVHLKKMIMRRMMMVIGDDLVLVGWLFNFCSSVFYYSVDI